MVITLLGYMGSGKSSIGRLLAERLQYDFIDLDEYIMVKEGKEISHIFAEKGEIYFRKLEHACLQELLSGDRRVLSVGGGTPVYHDNMKYIRDKSISFYLRMTPAELGRRLLSEKSKRPLISHLPDEELTEFIAKHLFERSSYYEQAGFKINNNALTLEEACEEIFTQIQDLDLPR